MAHNNRLILLILLGLALLLFCLAVIPNLQASDNLAMVTMLEPDEGVVVPVMQKMISGGSSLKQTLRRFIVYEYYYYGLPFFGFGALLMLALRGLGLEGNVTLLMLVLRQVLSTLPTLAGLLVLTYIQDQYKTWRSIAIFLFLALIPATLRNALWLHPDGLVILFSAFVLYFLWKDEHQLGKHFYWAAVFCGLLTATKLVGLYFFLAVLLCLVWFLANKQGNWKQFIKASLSFISIMMLCFLFANGFLFSKYGRIQYLYTLQGQANWLAQGYGTIYTKGISAALQSLVENFGSVAFILLAFVVTAFALWHKRTRFQSAIILTWVLPLSISVLFFTHFKYQYWLPVALPLFSSIVLLLPDKSNPASVRHFFPRIIQLGVIVFIIVQALVFFKTDQGIIQNRLTALNENKAISFYNESMLHLNRLENEAENVFYDYRLYLPPTKIWTTHTSYDLLNYAFIEENKFTILMLSSQRIADYLNPNAIGVDPVEFAENQRFYSDADKGNIQGYHLLYRNQTALLFISQQVCVTNYPKESCHQ